MLEASEADPRLNEIRTAFSEFDFDKDSMLLPRECREAFEALGIDTESKEVRIVLSKFENDKENIGPEEFEEIVLQLLEKVEPEHQVISLFELFDIDCTGKISLQNLQEVAAKLGDSATTEELQSMIEVFDQDGDGELNIEEFLEIFRNQDTNDVT